MTWQHITVAPSRTHHLRDGHPAYAERFDAVLKFHAPGIAPVRRGHDAWHIHPDGRAAYARRFRQTFGFYEKLAAVAGAGGWHHIDPGGDDVYPQRYAWCGNFQGGRCTVRQADGRYFHLTPEGEPAYDERWRYAGDFRDGIGVIQDDSGRSTHIDAHGQRIHDRWFVDLDVFHKNFARARDQAGWMHIDVAGQPIYARRFAAVEPFYNGQARVERHDGGVEVIDKSGASLVELRPALRSEFATLSADLVGFWRTRTIAAAVELDVFEALPGSSASVATRCGLRPDRARRLLRALAELALVARDGDQWRPTARGAYLQAEHPCTLAGAAREYGRYFSRMWEALPKALREKEDWVAPDIFGDVARDQSRRHAHHRMLLSYARHDYAAVPDVLALAGNERIVDAGGGLGGLASMLVERYPKIRVTVLDRPEVVDMARANAAGSHGPGMDRIEWRGCDLFGPWNVHADAIILARVLHDWNDEGAVRILARARSALASGSTLFVVEMLVPEDGVAGSLCDLHLLMATGGQERTAPEYASLLEQADFALTEVRPLAALPSVLVAVAR